jgi:hypothetical protein
MAVETQTKLDPKPFTDSIVAGWREFLKGRPPSPPHSYVYASAWRACTRRMVLDMTDCDKLPPFEAEQLANFRRGEDRERDLLADLAKIGRNAPIPFQVVGQQERFEVRDRKGRVCIVGKRDAEIKFEDGTRAPLEVKSWSQNTVAHIAEFADLFKSPWTRSGAYQLLAYLYGFGRPLGFMLLDRHGLPLPVAVELEPHLAEMEDFMTRAELALDHAQAGTLPDFIDDPEECQRCPFMGSVCNPNLQYSAAQVLEDAELAATLERRTELESAWREYKALDELAKKRLKNIDLGICGKFLIEGNQVNRKAYAVKAGSYWQTKITRV